MALKTFILENDTTKKKRQTDVQNAVREYLKNPKAKVVYDEKGRPSVEGAENVHISITCANKVMLLVIYEKAIGIDGEYLPNITAEGNKIDHMTLAERFFAYDEVEYLRDSARETERENFVKIWVRKEAYIKAAGKTLADFPNFSVVDGNRFAKKVHGVSIKAFAIKFEDCENYIFAIAGID